MRLEGLRLSERARVGLRCRGAFAWVAALAAAAGCGSPAPAAPAADPVGLLLFGDGKPGPVLTFARRDGGANLCAANPRARALFPGVGIHAVTRANPFQPYPELNGGGCDVYSRDTPRAAAAGGQVFRYGRCAIAFRQAGARRAIDIAPLADPGDDRFVLAECFYRLALYIEGYRGALIVPTTPVFVRTVTGFFAGRTEFVGPLATTMPIWLSRQCPTLTQLYHHADFADEFRRRCRWERRALRSSPGPTG